jgi:tetratricopeptide (TPR) repeat protein
MTIDGRKNIDSEPSAESIQTALDAVLNSDNFINSTRLQEFLTYVVKASFDGNGNKIPAKVISEDVYKRAISSKPDNDNVVRVDAGRLRRRLEQYYLGAGKNDPVRICMDSGGYVPRFEVRNFPEESDSLQTPNRRSFVFGVLLVLCIIAIGTIFYFLGANQGNLVAIDNKVLPTKTDEINQDHKVLRRKAVLEKSQISLQAINLADQARGLMFPIFDHVRIKLANGLFRESIKKDAEYSGGYAGVAQTLGILALLSPEGPKRKKILAEAQQFARKAVSINPTYSWAQSATAWVAFVSRDYDRAVRLSNLAIEISPDDKDTIDFHGLISLFVGDFEMARETADPNRTGTEPNRRFVNRNVYGVANYHLGEHATTVASLNMAAHLGEPVSALALVYLTAAYHAMGDFDKAADKAMELMTTWPNFHADKILRILYRYREHADAVIIPLQAAGWTTPTQPPAGASRRDEKILDGKIQ